MFCLTKKVNFANFLFFFSYLDLCQKFIIAEPDPEVEDIELENVMAFHLNNKIVGESIAEKKISEIAVKDLTNQAARMRDLELQMKDGSFDPNLAPRFGVGSINELISINQTARQHKSKKPIQVQSNSNKANDVVFNFSQTSFPTVDSQTAMSSSIPIFSSQLLKTSTPYFSVLNTMDPVLPSSMRPSSVLLPPDIMRGTSSSFLNSTLLSSISETFMSSPTYPPISFLTRNDPIDIDFVNSNNNIIQPTTTTTTTSTTNLPLSSQSGTQRFRNQVYSTSSQSIPRNVSKKTSNSGTINKLVTTKPLNHTTADAIKQNAPLAHPMKPAVQSKQPTIIDLDQDSSSEQEP